MSKTENMASLLLTLTQSDEWFRICNEDTGIKEADGKLQAVIDKLPAGNPDELSSQLWEAICHVNTACMAAAMLYGIRVANAIRDVSAKDIAFSAQVLQQSRKQAEKEVTI